MNLAEAEMNQKYDKQCLYCARNAFLPQENEWTFKSCGYSVVKRKKELTRKQQKKLFKRLKNAQKKITCICIDVFKIMKVMIMKN